MTNQQYCLSHADFMRLAESNIDQARLARILCCSSEIIEGLYNCKNKDDLAPQFAQLEHDMMRVKESAGFTV